MTITTRLRRIGSTLPKRKRKKFNVNLPLNEAQEKSLAWTKDKGEVSKLLETRQQKSPKVISDTEDDSKEDSVDDSDISKDTQKDSNDDSVVDHSRVDISEEDSVDNSDISEDTQEDHSQVDIPEEDSVDNSDISEDTQEDSKTDPQP
ncbi:MAG: hypothetical protein ACI8RD_006476 [Bacillariaceae sp.]|jgi:hypothetical protein